MIHEHVLGGCTPAPLAHYLKALGILRLVSEQKDPQAAGCWQGEQFVLRTGLSREELERFFLEEYRPTPIVAPWNGGSGFYPNDNKGGIDSIAAAQTGRLSHYSDVITLARKCVGLREESPKNDEKSDFLCHLRAHLPDSALLWFDAAVMLTTEKPEYPPLLGTGGNDGRLDFTNNFMQRVSELFDSTDGNPSPKSFVWLSGALSGEAAHGLVTKAIGQFSPGNAGGPNATTGFGTDSLMNPWDFVLMLEGALLFAGAATRRMESSDASILSYPFTVRTTGSGAGCGNVADEAPSRAEIWMPLWNKAISAQELRLLLAEGRVTVGRRAARDGLDFARAVGGYGVDRGISSFQRYAFLMRSGKAYLATPLARIKVFRNPQIDLVAHLDRAQWLERLRRFARDKNAPSSIQQLVRCLEDAIFSLTQGGGCAVLQNLLVLIGHIQQTCANSNKAREALVPVPLLGQEWALEADDNSHEFRLACALAGLTEIRGNLLPIKVNKGKIEWDTGSHHAVWGGGQLVGNLLRVLNRRLLDAQRGDQADKSLTGLPAADLAAVLAFLRGETDDERIAGLLAGLVNVKLPQHLPRRELPADQPPATFGLLKPLFTPDAILQKLGLLPADAHLPLPREIVTLLKTGNRDQVNRAIEIAWRRLRIAGLKLPTHPGQPPDLVGIDGARLAAALMIPLAMGDLARICQPFTPIQKAD
ncbi:MAG: type I-U CRISPR-associated protein Csx17 [Desulfuromonas thiophila]|jgi:CRISPR-associated protein Csx17|nr:type I-U CRISPR-associated protein Csx17 [Desulfuromonas thiophila]MDY0397132.1 type I-U CRISPR-associated protein Csx17 [Desulfuromonas thiophila]